MVIGSDFQTSPQNPKERETDLASSTMQNLLHYQAASECDP